MMPADDRAWPLRLFLLQGPRSGKKPQAYEPRCGKDGLAAGSDDEERPGGSTFPSKFVFTCLNKCSSRDVAWCTGERAVLWLTAITPVGMVRGVKTKRKIGPIVAGLRGLRTGCAYGLACLLRMSSRLKTNPSGALWTAIAVGSPLKPSLGPSDLAAQCKGSSFYRRRQENPMQPPPTVCVASPPLRCNM